jgi:hypothetical protein
MRPGAATLGSSVWNGAPHRAARGNSVETNTVRQRSALTPALPGEVIGCIVPVVFELCAKPPLEEGGVVMA